MRKRGKILGLFGFILLSLFVIAGCGGDKKASAGSIVVKIDKELQAKVKSYADGVEKPLADITATLEKLEKTYQDIGYQRLEKASGKLQLINILNEVNTIYDQFIVVASQNSSPEVDKIVSFFNGAVYREKESLEHTVATDLSKAELNQSLKTTQDSRRQIDKGIRDLEQLKQSVGLGENK